ncbi:hypothetical protein OPIT5_02465 [Opitutaceae bacterium TAV5]|nr:hypothetical protein OPIT5_02465 [Opitutaceae bacterium TAV5]
MNAFRANSVCWIAGVTAALAGALLVRLVTPALAPDHARAAAVLSTAGHLLALAGLGIICFGVSRRLRRDGAFAASDEDTGTVDVVPITEPPPRNPDA